MTTLPPDNKFLRTSAAGAVAQIVIAAMAAKASDQAERARYQRLALLGICGVVLPVFLRSMVVIVAVVSGHQYFDKRFLQDQNAAQPAPPTATVKPAAAAQPATASAPAPGQRI